MISYLCETDNLRPHHSQWFGIDYNDCVKRLITAFISPSKRFEARDRFDRRSHGSLRCWLTWSLTMVLPHEIGPSLRQRSEREIRQLVIKRWPLRVSRSVIIDQLSHRRQERLLRRLISSSCIKPAPNPHPTRPCFKAQLRRDQTNIAAIRTSIVLCS